MPPPFRAPRPAVVILADAEGRTRCSGCAALVRPDARMCGLCHQRFESSAPAAAAPAAVAPAAVAPDPWAEPQRMAQAAPRRPPDPWAEPRPTPAFAPREAPPRPADEGPWECPRCQRELERADFGEVVVFGCTTCGGLALERAGQARALVDETLWPALSAHALALQRDATRAVDGRALGYLHCPRCSGPLARKNFERVSGVIVDECHRHGTWFDGGELEAALAFLARGGATAKARFEAREAAYLAEQRASIQAIEDNTASLADRWRPLGLLRPNRQRGLSALFDD